MFIKKGRRENIAALLVVKQQTTDLLLLLLLILLASFCELVNSLLQEAEDSSPKLDHVAEGVLEVSPPFCSYTHQAGLALTCLNKSNTHYNNFTSLEMNFKRTATLLLQFSLLNQNIYNNDKFCPQIYLYIVYIYLHLLLYLK